MVSNVPWSNFSEADYTLQQWHNACLIHLHDGPPTSKNQCKLPVKTPNGVVNKNGVYAAAAALAGARTALKAPIEQKAIAARKLRTLYQQLGAKPPASLFSLGHSIDVDAFLEHHGVKGMRWGVINKDPLVGRRPTNSTGSSASKKEYLDILSKSKGKTFSKAEQARALAENRQKFSDKFGKETKKDDKKGWRPTGKQVAIAATGAAFIGLAIFAATPQGRALVKELGSGIGSDLTDIADLPVPGAKVDPKTFVSAVNTSQYTTWNGLGGQNFLKPSSFEQPALSFPKGHIFHRISRVAEDSLDGSTYSVPDVSDFNRYLFGFTKETGTEGLHHLTFSAKEAIKVPDLTTAIDTYRETIEKVRGLPVSNEEALKVFQTSCGGPWDGAMEREYFSNLSKKGYHAIIDYMDDDVIGESPLMIFNPNAFTPPSASPITADVFKSAEQNLFELSHRKI